MLLVLGVCKLQVKPLKVNFCDFNMHTYILTHYWYSPLTGSMVLELSSLSFLASLFLSISF